MGRDSEFKVFLQETGFGLGRSENTFETNRWLRSGGLPVLDEAGVCMTLLSSSLEIAIESYSSINHV
jgi:hypothetical protein